MISKEETEHIAKLARLGLSGEEIAKYQNDLSAILGYIDKLKEADVAGVAPFTHSVALVNIVRKDEKMVRTNEETGKLQGAFPESKDGFLKVKSIF